MTEKDKIVNKAEALFMRFGLKSVSMDDIAREIGISKKTLYQSVDNKEDLIKEIVVKRIETEIEIVDSVNEKAQNAMEEILGFSRQITKELRGISPGVIYELQKYYHEIFKIIESFHNEFIYKTILDNLQRGIEEGIYRKNIKAEIVAKLYVANNILIVDEGAFSLREYHPDELFQEHIRYHIYGVASPKGIKLLDKLSMTNEK